MRQERASLPAFPKPVHQHVAAVAVIPVADEHLRSPYARTRVYWRFVRYGGLPGGHDGEGPSLVVIIIILIIIDRVARGRGGPEAMAAGTAAVAMTAAVTVAVTVVAV